MSLLLESPKLDIIITQTGSKYISLIEFIIKFSFSVNRAVFDDLEDLLLKSLLSNDNCLFKLCLSQIELGLIQSLETLKRILIFFW